MREDLPIPFSGDSNNYGNWISAFGNIAGGAGSLFSRNPADSASYDISSIYPMLEKYLSPYINNGQIGFNNLNNYMGVGNTASNLLLDTSRKLILDPTSIMSSIGNRFQRSPGYNWQMGQSIDAANRAAAAGGMAGSPAEQQQVQTTANQLANQDFYNYLNHGLSVFGQGFSGLNNLSGLGLNAASDIYGIGANSANELASNLGSLGLSKANLDYAGDINKNQSDMGGWGSLAEGIGQIASLAGWL